MEEVDKLIKSRPSPKVSKVPTKKGEEAQVSKIVEESVGTKKLKSRAEELRKRRELEDRKRKEMWEGRGGLEE